MSPYSFVSWSTFQKYYCCVCWISVRLFVVILLSIQWLVACWQDTFLPRVSVLSISVLSSLLCFHTFSDSGTLAHFVCIPHYLCIPWILLDPVSSYSSPSGRDAYIYSIYTYHFSFPYPKQEYIERRVANRSQPHLFGWLRRRLFNRRILLPLQHQHCRIWTSVQVKCKLLFSIRGNHEVDQGKIADYEITKRELKVIMFYMTYYPLLREFGPVQVLQVVRSSIALKTYAFKYPRVLSLFYFSFQYKFLPISVLNGRSFLPCIHFWRRLIKLRLT